MSIILKTIGVLAVIGTAVGVNEMVSKQRKVAKLTAEIAVLQRRFDNIMIEFNHNRAHYPTEVVVALRLKIEELNNIVNPRR